MEILEEFQKKFNIEELKIYETKHWIWSLRPNQATLGSGVLSLKRECATFGELKPEEYSDLNNIVKVIENTLKNSFDYDIINYLMLMMVDKHVHYHIIPRYRRQINLFNFLWLDKGWPGLPNLSGESMDITNLQEINTYIQNNINK
ncbi:HIT family protein [Bacillus salacetis]|uniref:HIT family protein n=1 Tax=Bacillus salacetis TaxID=2315464 RepID=UPI003BA35074